MKIKYGGTMEHIRYKKETEVVTFQGKEITLENLSPVQKKNNLQPIQSKFTRNHKSVM